MIRDTICPISGAICPISGKNPDGGISSDLPPIYPFGVFDRRKGKFAERVSSPTG
jgi:hypothetical protein